MKWYQKLVFPYKLAWEIFSWNQITCRAQCSVEKFVKNTSAITIFTEHTVTCGNYGNSLSYFFDKNFVKPTDLLKKLLKSWFHEMFFRWERISEISTLCDTLCGKMENSLSLKINFVKSTIYSVSWFHEIFAK